LLGRGQVADNDRSPAAVLGARLQLLAFRRPQTLKVFVTERNWALQRISIKVRGVLRKPDVAVALGQRRTQVLQPVTSG
jgi:hypothetical protein